MLESSPTRQTWRMERGLFYSLPSKQDSVVLTSEPADLEASVSQCAAPRFPFVSSLSVRLSVCLSVCLSLCLSMSVCVFLSVVLVGYWWELIMCFPAAGGGKRFGDSGNGRVLRLQLLGGRHRAVAGILHRINIPIKQKKTLERRPHTPRKRQLCRQTGPVGGDGRTYAGRRRLRSQTIICRTLRGNQFRLDKHRHKYLE